MTDWAVPFGGKTKLTSGMWNATSDTIESDGTPHNLVFVWVNDMTTPLSPGACIDNINIVPAEGCAKPSDISIAAQDEKVTIAWKGNADSYDIRYRIITSDEWHEQNGLTSNSVTVDGMGEGVYDVYVRANCGTEHSVWVSHSQFVFYAGTRCIDFLDLNDSNCYIGTFEQPKQRHLAVDSGYRSMYSRHTIHYNQNEYDPRTDYRLKTVPEGEIASVRLGNWNWGHQGEAIRYKYHVDATTSAILLLQYAVVLENPDGHGVDEQPRFTLNIVEDDGTPEGKPIEKGCGEADFFAGFNTEDWNVVQPQGDADAKVLWKDWTTVGINLADYDGKDLIIELTTYDCGQQTHYGYAYFTLNCSGGQLTGLSCGEDQKSGFQAPEGFNYRWYLKDDPTKETITTERTMEIDASDTRTYVCEVIQPTNPDCFYTLEAVATPRWPLSGAVYQIKAEDCTNRVEFTNTSSIILVDPATGDTTYTDEQCESTLWDFGDGTQSAETSPVHIYEKGGQYTVTLTSGIAGDKCQDTWQFTLDLPKLETQRDTTHAVSCYGVPYKDENGTLRYTTGVYSDTITDETTGCIHIHTLDFVMYDKNTREISDTACTDDLPYVFNGKEYNESCTFTDTLKDSHGCDSIVTVNLLVNTSLDISFDTDIWACADDSAVLIAYEVQSGIASSYSVTFTDNDASAMNVENGKPEDEHIEIGLPEGILPGTYAADITFDNADCGDATSRVQIHINYPDSIVVQRWNDVLGVRNSGYNGGYEFAAFQWYKDGQKLEGENGPNLYEEDGLDQGAQYTVLLTRADDGVEAYTCAFIPETFADIEDKPTVTFHSGTVSVKSETGCSLRVWSAAGVLMGEYTVGAGTAEIPMSAPAGVYIIETVTNDGTREIQKIIINN